jgi:protein N-terminal methyltransferase
LFVPIHAGWESSGYDSNGRFISSLELLWHSFQSAPSPSDSKTEKIKASTTATATTTDDSVNAVEVATMQEYFDKGNEYWTNIKPSLDGIMGGFPKITKMDLQGTSAFLDNLRDICLDSICDMGGGIGRCTGLLFIRKFAAIDFVEPNLAYLNAAKKLVGVKQTKMTEENFIHTGLESFTPAPNKYNIMFVQWVLGHLPDKLLVKFLRRCAKGLKPGGYIVVKENLSETKLFNFDLEDYAITRAHVHWRHVFKQAGLAVVKEKQELGYLEVGLLPVIFWALQPVEWVEDYQEPPLCKVISSASLL